MPSRQPPRRLPTVPPGLRFAIEIAGGEHRLGAQHQSDCSVILDGKIGANDAPASANCAFIDGFLLDDPETPTTDAEEVGRFISV